MLTGSTGGSSNTCSKIVVAVVNRGSYVSAHILLNLLKSWEKEIKCKACGAFYLFFATSFINSIIQEHES